MKRLVAEGPRVYAGTSAGQDECPRARVGRYIVLSIGRYHHESSASAVEEVSSKKEKSRRNRELYFPLDGARLLTSADSWGCRKERCSGPYRSETWNELPVLFTLG